LLINLGLPHSKLVATIARFQIDSFINHTSHTWIYDIPQGARAFSLLEQYSIVIPRIRKEASYGEWTPSHSGETSTLLSTRNFLAK